MDPSQLLKFMVIVADVPEIKATKAKLQYKTDDKISMHTTVIQRLQK